MSLTKEDLNAIDMIVKSNIQGLENRMDGLENRMDGLENKMDRLENKMDRLENRVSGLENRVSDLEQDMRAVKVVILENTVLPVLFDLQSCYKDTYERYRNGAEKFECEFDHIDTMDKTIKKHSKQIHALQKSNRG